MPIGIPNLNENVTEITLISSKKIKFINARPFQQARIRGNTINMHKPMINLTLLGGI
jgi:hypothetical protein